MRHRQDLLRPDIAAPDTSRNLLENKLHICYVMLVFIEYVSESVREDAMTTTRDPQPSGSPDEPYDHQALTPAERTALARLENGEELLAADEAALAQLGDDLCGPEDDSGRCPPEKYDAWLADLAAAARDALPGVPGPEVPDWLDAGFTHREGTGGAGFAAGGVLDRTPAGWLLAMAADRTWDNGLGQLSDPELVGLLSAAQRNGSRQAALGLAVIGELAARRAGPDGIPGEHLQDEVAAVLTLTGWTAARQVALAAAMTRLPDVAAAGVGDDHHN